MEAERAGIGNQQQGGGTLDHGERTWRVGLTVIFLALAFRLTDAGLWRSWAAEQLHSEEKTGQSVRFSPSWGDFLPDFVESPPPVSPEPAAPVFTGEEAVEIYYGAKADPDVSALLTQPLSWDLRGETPRVLILHTHTTESYTKKDESYGEVSAWRTLEEDYNMLSIGERVARLLEEAGIPAIQDREVHDYPSYNGSYAHARSAIRDYLEEYPGICLILDLHRDASGGAAGQLRTLAQVDGEDSAQLMVVLGINHENFEANLSLGLKLHTLLEQTHPGITRPLQLRSQRFNQDLSPGALLIEVGAAGNSHREAMKAAQALAEAVIALAEGTA